jgi:hypothetical protein
MGYESLAGTRGFRWNTVQGVLMKTRRLYKEDLTARLERNKIYFETVAASCVAVMSLIVAIVAVIVALYANELLEQQNQIMRTQSAPLLQFEVRLSKDPKTGNYEHESLNINNFGGSLDEFSAEYLYFVHAFFQSNVPAAQAKDKSIPLFKYYIVNVLSGSRTGQLEQSDYYGSEGNNGKFSRLESEFMELARQHNGYGTIELDRYVHVTYHDIFGTPFDEVYAISSTGSRKLSPAEGAQIINMHGGAFSGLDFDTLTTQQIYDWLLQR